MIRQTLPCLVCCGLALTLSPKLLAEQTATDTATVETVTETPVSEDGSTQVHVETLVTDTDTGKTTTVTHEIDGTRTPDGGTWTRDTTVSGPHGGHLESHTQGQAVRNGDGTGTWSSETQGTRTKPDGEQVDYNVQREGQWSKNAQGGRDFSVDRSFENENGRTATSHTEGSSQTTENGRTWSTTTTGSNDKGRTWTGTATGSTTRNEDGSVSVEGTRTVTNDKGKTLTVEHEGTVTKGEDGKRTYEGERTVTREGGEQREGKTAKTQTQKRERTTNVQRQRPERKQSSQGARGGSSRRSARN